MDGKCVSSKTILKTVGAENVSWLLPAEKSCGKKWFVVHYAKPIT